MSIYERISLVVSVTLLGLAIYFLIELPDRTVQLVLFGSQQSLVVSQRWLMAFLLGGLTATGTSGIIHAHPHMIRWNSSYSLAFWLLPSLLVILATSMLPLLAFDVVWWIVGIGAVGVLLWVTILAEYHTVDPRDQRFEISHFWLNLMGYTVVFGFLTMIHLARGNGILPAVAAFLVSALVAASLLRAGPEQNTRTWLFSGVVALIMGQSIWALDFWRVPAVTGGLWLLLIFYLLTGLAQQQILGRFTRRALLEYIGITVLGFVAIAQFAP
jgi:hypothetical protein